MEALFSYIAVKNAKMHSHQPAIPKKKHKFFTEVGMTLLVDKSGKLFSMHGCSIKDILVNREDGDSQFQICFHYF